jgi:hypothetical protein
VAAKYILAVLAAGFLIAAAVGNVRDPGGSHLQSRTWFLVGVIFSAVSAWLWLRT